MAERTCRQVTGLFQDLQPDLDPKAPTKVFLSKDGFQIIIAEWEYKQRVLLFLYVADIQDCCRLDNQGNIFQGSVSWAGIDCKKGLPYTVYCSL